MSELQHIECIESVGTIAKDLCALSFGGFGSLYLNAGDRPPGTQQIEQGYCIGPHCGQRFWGYNDDQTIQAAVPRDLQGPCRCFTYQFFVLVPANLLKGRSRPLFLPISIPSVQRL